MRGAVGVFACLLLAALARPVEAQSRRAPPVTYFMAVAAADAGSLDEAGEQFQRELRGAIKTPDSRWIDSIPCHAMIAETALQRGAVRDALSANGEALQLAGKFAGWIKQCRLPDSIRPMQSGQIRACPWATSTRSTTPGDFPDVFMIAQGQVDVTSVVSTGGVIKPPSFFPVIGSEILRTTALSLRRRKELLGPTAPNDRLADELISAWNKQSGGGQWWEAWVNVQLGLAYAAKGNNALAAPLLQQGATIGGQLDHPLTAAALYELGRMELARGACDPASVYFLEASVAAFHFLDAGLIEDSLRAGWLAHRLSNRPGVYAPLEPAIAWAKKQGFNRLAAALLLLEAETAVAARDDATASNRLAEAQKVAQRTDLGTSRTGAAAQRLAALLAFRSGDAAAGDAALSAALGFMDRGSLWRLHVSLVDGLATAGTVGARESFGLYGGVLRDPSALDWLTEPLETLSFLAASDDAIRERWFETALVRKQTEFAFGIADSVRRERFFNTLPLGGRLTALRWTLHHPAPAPPAVVQQERLEILGKTPGYDEASRAAEALERRLAALGAGPLDGRDVKARDETLAAWATATASRETLLRAAAVDRASCSLVWPPIRPVAEIRERLAPRHAVLAFFATPREVHAFLVERQKYTHWVVGATPEVHRAVVDFLADLGCSHATRPLDESAWRSGSWKRSSRSLYQLLTAGIGRTDWIDSIDELAIVPDGALWYVPFETLDVAPEPAKTSAGSVIDERLDALGTRVRIRYAPTGGLAVADHAAPPVVGDTVVLAGKLFPRDDGTLAEALAGEVQLWEPRTVALSPVQRPRSPAVVNAWGRLIAFEEIAPPTGGPHEWSFVGGTEEVPGVKLSAWLNLPPEAPRQMLLPGFRTAAERGLRDASPALAGMDLFLPTMGLASSGVRTVLISRWRTGGRTAADLVREFTQELPHTSPADAWQRSVLLAAETTVDPAAEPRLEWKGPLPPRASHPFLWSGYLLVDPGTPAPLATAGK